MGQFGINISGFHYLQSLQHQVFNLLLSEANLCFSQIHSHSGYQGRPILEICYVSFIEA